MDPDITDTVDLLIIGWGKGGKTLAAKFAAQGKRVVMVEQSDQMYGGTCINIGCVPTKALIHDAEVRRPGDDAQATYQQAVGRKNTLTSAMRAKNYTMLDSLESVAVVTGRARFVGPREVEVSVGEDRLSVSAEAVVINTGALPVIPDIDGLATSSRMFTSTDLIASDALPRRLAIIGGGAIGLEFASMYHQFGAAVTVFESGSALLPREDDDVVAAVLDVLSPLEILTSATVTRVADTDDGVRVTFTHDDVAEDREYDAVLVASGRRPATDGLGLAEAGIDLTPSGAVRVDEFLRTSVPGVFAVGDVNGGPQFTYVSFDDHRIVLDQLSGSGRRSTADRTAVPTTVFITPPLARVGQSETEALASGHAITVFAKQVADIAAMPRPKIVGDPRGLIKVVAEAASGRILGAALFCVDSQELINLLALAIRHGLTVADLRDGIWTHPSSTEALNEVLASTPA